MIKIKQIKKLSLCDKLQETREEPIRNKNYLECSSLMKEKRANIERIRCDEIIKKDTIIDETGTAIQ